MDIRGCMLVHCLQVLICVCVGDVNMHAYIYAFLYIYIYWETEGDCLINMSR